jgi:hypothetical protein
MKRILPAAMFALLLALSPPAWAQGQGHDGNAQGNGNEQSENAGGNNGQGKGNDQGNGNDAVPDNPGATRKPNDSSPPARPRELSEEEALAAVEAGKAVELATILPDVRSRTGGEVINAQLQQAGDFLIYAVTVLTPSGQVLTERYYARSGVPVGR